MEFLVLEDGTAPARDFLTQFTPEAGQRYRHQQRMLAAIDLFANTPPGRHLSAETFKRIEGSNGVFEFKAYQHRVYCFYGGAGRLILAFGVLKKKDKHSRADVERAEAYRAAFLRK